MRKLCSLSRDSRTVGVRKAGLLMVAPAVEGIDLFKIAGRSISGWIPSLKTGAAVRQPFCSQLEERLMLWLEYHPQVKSYARGDIGPQFATTYRLPIPKHAPFAIGYTFQGKPHEYLPDVVGMMTNGGIATSPKRRPHEGLPAFNKASSGLGPSADLPNVATTTWSSCMPGARRFPSLLTLLPPCKRSGRGEKWLLSTR